MDSAELSCISELLLNRAHQAIDGKNFKEAAKLIAMVVAEIDEGFNVAGYVENKITKLDQKDLSEFIGEMSVELDSLCPQAHIGRQERRRMLAFRDAMVPIFGDLGWVLEVCRDEACSNHEEAKEADQNFSFIPKRKKPKNHPYS